MLFHFCNFAKVLNPISVMNQVAFFLPFSGIWHICSHASTCFLHVSLHRETLLSKVETEKLFEVFITLNNEVMAQGTDHSLRCCLADWAAACCTRFPDLLPLSVGMLLSFVNDAPPTVLRSGICALAQLLRPALVLICDSDIHSAGAMADLNRLWDGLAAACAAVRGFAAHPDTAARHAAIKFLERCALLLSLADEDRAGELNIT